MGSHLNSRDRGDWEEAAQLLQEGCDVGIDEDQQIFKRLKISYDALDSYRKEMFLDVACLLLGRTEEFAGYVWHHRGRCA